MRREAKKLLKEKRDADNKYWKERDWEALQKKRRCVCKRACACVRERKRGREGGREGEEEGGGGGVSPFFFFPTSWPPPPSLDVCVLARVRMYERVCVFCMYSARADAVHAPTLTR